MLYPSARAGLGRPTRQRSPAGEINAGSDFGGIIKLIIEGRLGDPDAVLYQRAENNEGEDDNETTNRSG